MVNQANKRIGRHLGGGIRNIGLIGQIGPIVFINQLPDILCLGMPFIPESQSMLAQIILIIQEKFFQAGPCELLQKKCSKYALNKAFQRYRDSSINSINSFELVYNQTLGLEPYAILGKTSPNINAPFVFKSSMA